MAKNNVLLDTRIGDVTSIDGMVIGGTTAAAGTFTNLTTTGTATIGGLIYEEAVDGITASATQTQTGATQLVAEINRITTNATAGNAVKLPTSAAGLDIIVINATAKPIQVFGSGASDTINGGAAAASVTQMPYSVVLYVCSLANNWFTEGIGQGYSGSLSTFSFADGLTAGATTNAVTFTNSSANIGWTAETLTVGQAVTFTTTGSLPTNFAVNTIYYVVATATNTFTVSATVGGTAIIAGSAGSGTQTVFVATPITTSSARFTTVGGAGYPAVLPTAVAGVSITVINAGANVMNVQAQNGDAMNGVTSGFLPIAANGVVEFFTTAVNTWHTLAPQAPIAISYSTSSATAGFTATGANISGGFARSVLNLTGTLGAGQTLTLPSVAATVSALQTAGLNPIPGMTWEFEIQNNSSGAYAWTLAVDAGTTWGSSITGTAGTLAVAHNVAGKFLMTLTSLTAGTVRTLGNITIQAAP